MKGTKNKRRAFPVTSSVQYTFLAFALAYGFVIVSFVAAAIFVPDVLEMQDESLSPVIRSTAASRILAKHAWALPACLSLVIVLALHSFRTFHKVMGPLHRFRCAFDELSKGNILYPVKIRERDYLHGEEEALGRMMSALAERIKNIKAATQAAVQSIREIEESANSTDEWTKIRKDSLIAHREHLENLETTLGFFQLHGESSRSKEPAAEV